MNRKIIKKINKQVPVILVGWLRTLVGPEEHSKISALTLDKYLPELQYISIEGTYVLGQFSKRWTNRLLKKLVKDGHFIEHIDYDYFNKYYRDYMYAKQTKG